jgi:RES domain-containing protein
MPLVWRLTSPAYARVLDGEGNRITGARWNSPGRGVVYTSANLSLCVLETYVHIPPPLREALPSFAAVCLNVPDDAEATRVGPAELQRLISASNPQAAFRSLGDKWLSEARNLLLMAPSVVVPEELNIMLNPAHARMRDVQVVSTRPFQFDPRLVAARV